MGIDVEGFVTHQPPEAEIGAVAVQGVNLGEQLTSAEAPLFPRLVEQYGDTIVTIRGVTGTLSALSGLCPVPEAERSAESNETWAGNILTEAGVDWQTPRGIKKEPNDIEIAVDADSKKK